MGTFKTFGQKTATEINCDDNGCIGTYVGLEFDSTKPKTDIAHQFSNDMCDAVGYMLKQLYKEGKYSKVDFSKIEMTTVGMDQKDNVTYYLKIPFTAVAAKCDAYTSFDHAGGWGHVPELDDRKKQLASGLLDGDELNISDLKKTSEGLQEYWIQWRNKTEQADCAKPKSTPTPGKARPNIKVTPANALQCKSWDDMHTFSIKRIDPKKELKGNNIFGLGMHWMGGQPGGPVVDAMVRFYKEKKLNPCVRQIKITVDAPNMTVSYEVNIGESPDGVAYTGFSSWGGADANYPTEAPPRDGAYDNYVIEKNNVIANNKGTVIKDVLDFWFPGGFRQIFFQFTRSKYPNLANRHETFRPGKVGITVGPKSPGLTLPKYNGILFDPNQYDDEVQPKKESAQDVKDAKKPEEEVAKGSDGNSGTANNNKKEETVVKFKMNLSAYLTQWQKPQNFETGVAVDTELPSFYIFVGDEQTSEDAVAGFQDTSYDELDPEYIEDIYSLGEQTKGSGDVYVTGDTGYNFKAVPSDGGGGGDEDYSDAGSYESGEPAVLGDGADYWSLIACCLLEAGSTLAAEVAQCIYNRYGTPNRPYGSTIKGIVIAKWQFEVAFNKSPRNGNPAPAWKAIKNRDTAIKAVQYTKGGDYEAWGKELDKCEKTLKDPEAQKAALKLVGGRTGFRSKTTKMGKSKISVKQTKPNGNKFCWEKGTAGYRHYYLQKTDSQGKKYWNKPAGVPDMFKS